MGVGEVEVVHVVEDVLELFVVLVALDLWRDVLDLVEALLKLKSLLFTEFVLLSFLILFLLFTFFLLLLFFPFPSLLHLPPNPLHLPPIPLQLLKLLQRKMSHLLHLMIQPFLNLQLLKVGDRVLTHIELLLGKLSLFGVFKCLFVTLLCQTVEILEDAVDVTTEVDIGVGVVD